jgi:hypothetical protein
MLLIGSGRLGIFCVKLHVIVIVLVTVIIIARMKPLLLPKIRARCNEPLFPIA